MNRLSKLMLAAMIGLTNAMTAHADQDAGAFKIEDAADQTDEISKRKAQDADQAPDGIKILRATTLATYFPLVTLTQSAHQIAVKRLRADLRELHDYFERDDANPKLKERTVRGLDRYVAQLSYARVMRARFGDVQQLRDTTLEQIVADQSARAALKSRNVWRRLGDLMGVKHLRGATAGATVRVLGHAFRWVGRQFTPDRDIHWKDVKSVLKVAVPLVGLGLTVDHFTHSHLLTGFVLGSMWGAVQAGPIAHLVSASTSWFLTPTTQYIQIWSKRRTGDAEQKIQSWYNSLSASLGGEANMDQMRPATLERDNSNIADMPAAMQMRSFNRMRTVFLALENWYGRLLNKAEHHGRWLLTALWSDELDTMTAVHLGLGFIDALNSQVKVILNPYRTKLVLDGDHAENARLAEGYARLVRDLDGHDWALGPPNRELTERVENYITDLRTIHVPEVEIREIMQLQERRSFLLSHVITALAVNEARYLIFPEGNRNMPDDAREIQRKMRDSYRLQHYVSYFQKQIQTIHREMGLRDDKEPGECERALDDVKKIEKRAA